MADIAVPADVHCDLLLFVATSSELDQLKAAAKRLRIPFQRRRHEWLEEYYWMGCIGENRVIAVQTEMGPLGYGGSASKAIDFMNYTGATGLVQLGMAFGIDRKSQMLGDVLVSTSIIPYDLRDISNAPGLWNWVTGRYVADYKRAKRHRAKESLRICFGFAGAAADKQYKVHVGAMLSGGARIHSERFRDELLSLVPPGDDRIVGGEMEGTGLLAVSPTDDPRWVLVKGISDFADSRRDEEIKEARTTACANAAFLVLSALLKTPKVQ